MVKRLGERIELSTIERGSTRFQIATIMTIAGELIGIGAATGGTLPVDRTRLTTHPTWTSLRSSQLDRDFLLQTLLEYLGHPVDDGLLYLRFNSLENRSPLFSL